MKPIWGGLLLALGASAALLASNPIAAWATYPGANGLLAYESSGEILTIPPRGGEPTPLTDPEGKAFEPSWSADGRRIAYYQSKGSDAGVWTMRADGSHQHPIIRTSRFAVASFSPGGGRLVMADGHSLSTVGVDGTGLHRLVGGIAAEPEFSPDGRRIVFSGSPEGRGGYPSIWTIHRDGSHLRRLTRAPEYGIDQSPDWRPDGRRIIYTHCDYYDERNCEGNDYIRSMRPDGSHKRFVYVSDRAGVYSPNGNRIAGYFIQWDTIRQNELCGDIYTVGAHGSNRAPVTHNCDGNPTSFTGVSSSPSWQPIAKSLTVMARPGSRTVP